MNIDVQTLYRRLRSALTDIVGAGEAAPTAKLIFLALKGWDTTDLVVHAPDEVSDFILQRVDEILDRLRRHEPIQYILGQGRFYGMDLRVTPATLIPRQETEELVDLIVKRFSRTSDLRVLDVGTGSGAIAIALSRNLPFASVTAIDISEPALDVARDNAARLHAKIDFIRQDIFHWEPAPQSFDIIVSNPPYVLESEKKEMEANVLDYEPASALFVPDSDPLRFYRRIALIALRALAPGGSLYFEINPLCAEAIRKMLQDMGFEDVSLFQDISHRNRFISALCPKTSESRGYPPAHGRPLLALGAMRGGYPRENPQSRNPATRRR